MILKMITYFGKSVALICDANCSKAWGVNNRPTLALGNSQGTDDPDDWRSIPDAELGEAPADPGTYEGGYGKPRNEAERLNKWCARECERSAIVAEGEDFTLPDYSKPFYNIPRKTNE